MKRTVKSLIFGTLFLIGLGIGGLMCGAFTGCATHQVISAPVPGQTSALDAQVYRGLRDIQAVIDTYKGRVAAGTFHPSPEMVTGMDALTLAYNKTHFLWAAYHEAGTAAQADSGVALKASYDAMQSNYTNALKVGAPIPAQSTIGAKP